MPREADRASREGAFGRLPAFCRLGLALALAFGALAGHGATTLAPECALPSDATVVDVRYAIDGDTVKLADGRSLRITGLNALETGKRGAPDEPFAHEASVRLGALIRLGPVRFVPGTERFDRHGRTLGDLYAADGRLIAAVLAEEGLGVAVAVAPNLARVDCIAAAERRARAARKGLWADASTWTTDSTKAAGVRGFRRIEGRVTAVTRKRGGRAVTLEGAIELWLPDDAGPALDATRAALRPGDRIAARGWWGSYQGRPSLRIAHPAVVEFID